MTRKAKTNKLHLYFSEADEALYQELVQEAKDMEKPLSTTVLSYIRIGFNTAFTESDLLCEKCGGKL